MSLCYEIHSIKKLLKDVQFKSQEQIHKTESKKKEVNRLREEISRLKVMNSNLTIGVPINKIDVRRKLSDDTHSMVSDTRSSSASLG